MTYIFNFQRGKITFFTKVPHWWSWVQKILLVFFSTNCRGGGSRPLSRNFLLKDIFYSLCLPLENVSKDNAMRESWSSPAKTKLMSSSTPRVNGTGVRWPGSPQREMETTPPTPPGGEPGQEDNRAELSVIFPSGRSFRVWSEVQIPGELRENLFSLTCFDHFCFSHRLIRSLWLEKLRDNFTFIDLIKLTCENQKKYSINDIKTT